MIMIITSVAMNKNYISDNDNNNLHHSHHHKNSVKDSNNIKDNNNIQNVINNDKTL